MAIRSIAIAGAATRSSKLFPATLISSRPQSGPSASTDSERFLCPRPGKHRQRARAVAHAARESQSWRGNPHAAALNRALKFLNVDHARRSRHPATIESELRASLPPLRWIARRLFDKRMPFRFLSRLNRHHVPGYAQMLEQTRSVLKDKFRCAVLHPLLCVLEAYNRLSARDVLRVPSLTALSFQNGRIRYKSLEDTPLGAFRRQCDLRRDRCLSVPSGALSAVCESRCRCFHVSASVCW
jgi:hypothetical protein